MLGPFVALVLCCLGLLVAWTIVDPPSFVREDYNNILEIGEGSVGFCEENLWFSIPVDIIVLLAVALSFWMSTKTKHIPEDISDSKRVFQTLMSHLILLTGESLKTTRTKHCLGRLSQQIATDLFLRFTFTKLASF